MAQLSHLKSVVSPKPLGSGARTAIRTIILGAAGRDFHNFNTVFRGNHRFRVVAFTAAQISGISGRNYPPSLAGELYPEGIPILQEQDLHRLVKTYRVDLVVLAYSDLSHEEVMHKASITMAAGASYMLLGTRHTMLKARLPVISVCAVRTGAGKSPTSQRIARWAVQRGLRPAVVRHPMPYGDLEKQVVQGFYRPKDLDAAQCTIEEREEYEPYLRMGIPVFAGVDYSRILELAQTKADFIIWDGGNNDFPFVRPDLGIVILDPHRPGHELAYHPGEVNFRMADLFIVTKVDSATIRGMRQVLENIRQYKPKTPVVLADLDITVDHPELIEDKRVLVVEDGPTLTHGGVAWGAGVLAAQRYGGHLIDPRQWAIGSLQQILSEYKHIKNALPAMGYSQEQIKELEATIQAVPCDTVIDATPVTLSHLVKIDKPLVQVDYVLKERGPNFEKLLEKFAKRHSLHSTRGHLHSRVQSKV